MCFGYVRNCLKHVSRWLLKLFQQISLTFIPKWGVYWPVVFPSALFRWRASSLTTSFLTMICKTYECVWAIMAGSLWYQIAINAHRRLLPHSPTHAVQLHYLPTKFVGHCQILPNRMFNCACHCQVRPDRMFNCTCHCANNTKCLIYHDTCFTKQVAWQFGAWA